MNTTQLKPTTQKAVKGMKWAVYTTDTAPKFYKTLKQANIEQGFCDDTLHRSVYNGKTLGYTSTSSTGRTLYFDNLNMVNIETVESLFISMIEKNIQEVSRRIKYLQDND